MDMSTYIKRARAIGTEQGENAASWWEQDAIGGHVSAQEGKATATSILKGIEDGDPATYDALPGPDLSGEWADGYTTHRLQKDIGMDEETADVATNEALWDEVVCAYEEAYLDAVMSEVTRLCRAVLVPEKDVPADFPVRPLKDDEHPPGRTTCGTCGRSWDDDAVTDRTPVPSARCPFEPFH